MDAIFPKFKLRNSRKMTLSQHVVERINSRLYQATAQLRDLRRKTRQEIAQYSFKDARLRLIGHLRETHDVEGSYKSRRHVLAPAARRAERRNKHDINNLPEGQVVRAVEPAPLREPARNDGVANGSHAIFMNRLRQTRPWVVSSSSLSRFEAFRGPEARSRDASTLSRPHRLCRGGVTSWRRHLPKVQLRPMLRERH